MNATRQLVHVRVNDAATGQPTPVRIAFTSPAGEYFAPFGRLTEFASEFNEDVGGNLQLGSRKYAYIDGTCEIELPPGPILVEIHKGPEYKPRFLEVMLKPGQLALRTTVERSDEYAPRRMVFRRHPRSLPHAARGTAGSRRRRPRRGEFAHHGGH